MCKLLFQTRVNAICGPFLVSCLLMDCFAVVSEGTELFSKLHLNTDKNYGIMWNVLSVSVLQFSTGWNCQKLEKCIWKYIFISKFLTKIVKIIFLGFSQTNQDPIKLLDLHLLFAATCARHTAIPEAIGQVKQSWVSSCAFVLKMCINVHLGSLRLVQCI